MLLTSYAHQIVFSFTSSDPCALQLCRDAAGCYIFPQRVRPCCLREQVLPCITQYQPIGTYERILEHGAADAMEKFLLV